MKRLIITGLVIMSVASQSMAGAFSAEAPELVNALSRDVHISKQHASSIVDETFGFYSQLPREKRDACIAKVNECGDIEYKLDFALYMSDVPYAHDLLKNFRKTYQALERQGCFTPAFRQLAQVDLNFYEQHVQAMAGMKK